MDGLAACAALEREPQVVVVERSAHRKWGAQNYWLRMNGSPTLALSLIKSFLFSSAKGLLASGVAVKSVGHTTKISRQ